MIPIRLWSTVVTHDHAPVAGRAAAAGGAVWASVAIGSGPLQLCDVGVPVGLRDDLHGDDHRGVADPAELCALARERAGLVRLEPVGVRLAGDGVDLRAERGHPPV